MARNNYLHGMMSTNRRNTVNIEWVDSLEELAIKVPDNWWVSHNGTNLHNGKLVSFDEANQSWNLLLDTQDVAVVVICLALSLDFFSPSSPTSSFLKQWQAMLDRTKVFQLTPLLY